MIVSGFLIFCLITGSLQLNITEFSVPGYIQAGSNETLTCAYSLDENDDVNTVLVKWWWIPHNKTTRQLYQKIAEQPAQVIKNDINIMILGRDKVLLSQLAPEHSGIYECEVDASFGEQRKRQQVVVYTEGSGPELNFNDVIDNDTLLEIQCGASGVYPTPELVVSVDSTPLLNFTEEIETDDGLFNITVSVVLNKNDVLDNNIRCELFFADRSIPHPLYEKSLMYINYESVSPTSEEMALNFTSDDSSSASQLPPGSSSNRTTATKLLLLNVMAFILSHTWFRS